MSTPLSPISPYRFLVNPNNVPVATDARFKGLLDLPPVTMQTCHYGIPMGLPSTSFIGQPGPPGQRIVNNCSTATLVNALSTCNVDCSSAQVIKTFETLLQDIEKHNLPPIKTERLSILIQQVGKQHDRLTLEWLQRLRNVIQSGKVHPDLVDSQSKLPFPNFMVTFLGTMAFLTLEGFRPKVVSLANRSDLDVVNKALCQGQVVVVADQDNSLYGHYYCLAQHQGRCWQACPSESHWEPVPPLNVPSPKSYAFILQPDSTSPRSFNLDIRKDSQGIILYPAGHRF